MCGCGCGCGCVGGDCVMWVCGRRLCVHVERGKTVNRLQLVKTEWCPTGWTDHV